MRISIFFAAFLFSISSFAQTTVESKNNGVLQFVELDYGIAEVVDGVSEKLKNTPTGTHGWLKDFQITKVTDSVPVKIKENFGVVYIVKAKDTVDINIDIEWIYPEKIKNEKGEKYKSIRYTTKRPTNIPSASSYSLDAQYEMVKGNWIMNIYIEDKKVYTKTFLLY